MSPIWNMKHLKFQDQERRGNTQQDLSVTQRAILSEVGADIYVQMNCANPSRTLYAIFVKQLLTEGSMKWRQHESNVDICVMNDYNLTTGYLMPQPFVHVSCTDENGNLFLRCTCMI